MTAPALLSVDFGHAEPVVVHFDDLDPMGILHNARYAVLLERALSAYWWRRGHSFAGGRPTTPDVVHAVREYTITYHTPIRGTGETLVHFWLERLGESSAVYGFRFMSMDGETTYAEGQRVIVKLDPSTGRPAPWTPDGRAIATGLLKG
ncbi:MAG TPA: thioesterase family protein [Micromonosporaceae bacterium]|jgi:acyl-CoA thioester hydrolase|nr:thioesterase family protein [Micromonosporaceae bacterium]